MNILKSFEMFWSLPRKLFGNKFFKVQHVETKNAITGSSSSIDVDIDADSVYLNVYNSPKVYNLLSGVLYKKKKLHENKISQISKKCSFN